MNQIMENLKQISVKIDPVTLNRIERLAKIARYYKRNAVINNVLTTIFDCCQDEEIMILVRYWRHNPLKKPYISIQKKQENL